MGGRGKAMGLTLASGFLVLPFGVLLFFCSFTSSCPGHSKFCNCLCFQPGSVGKPKCTTTVLHCRVEKVSIKT